MLVDVLVDVFKFVAENDRLSLHVTHILSVIVGFFCHSTNDLFHYSSLQTSKHHSGTTIENTLIMILRWTILALLLIKIYILVIVFDGALLSEPFIRVGLWIIIQDTFVYSVFIDSFFVFNSLPFSRVYEELKVCDGRLEYVAYAHWIHISHDVVWFFCLKNSLIKYRSIFGSSIARGMNSVYINLLSPIAFLLFLVQNHHEVTRFQSCYFIYEILLLLYNVIFLAELV